MVIDLSDVTFIDSTGLRSILRYWNDVRGRGFELAIVPGSAQVQRVLTATGVDKVLPTVEASASAGNGTGPDDQNLPLQEKLPLQGRTAATSRPVAAGGRSSGPATISPTRPGGLAPQLQTRTGEARGTRKRPKSGAS